MIDTTTVLNLTFVSAADGGPGAAAYVVTSGGITTITFVPTRVDTWVPTQWAPGALNTVFSGAGQSLPETPRWSIPVGGLTGAISTVIFVPTRVDKWAPTVVTGAAISAAFTDSTTSVISQSTAPVAPVMYWY
jgi:hypothetical protein